MPDFAGAALGFLLQVEDQASAPLQKAERHYVSLAKAMDLAANTARKTSSRSSDSMALMAGSVDAVSKSSKKATEGVDLLVTALKKADKLHPINITTDFDGGKSGKSGGAAKNRITLRAQYPASGWRDPHFNRSSLLNAYKQLPVAPNYIMDLPGYAQGGTVSGGVPGRDSVAAMLTPGEVVLPVWLVNAFQKIMGQAGGRVDVIQTFAEGGMAGAAAEGLDTELVKKLGGSKDFTKVVSALKQINISGLEAIDKGRADAFAKAIKILTDDTANYAEKADVAIRATSDLNKLMGTMRITASKEHYPLVKLQTQLGVMPASVANLRKEVRAATGAFAGMEEAAIGVWDSLKQYHQAVFAAIESSASLPVALGAAAFTTAYVMDKAMFEVRQNIAMTDEQFKTFETAGMEAMGNFGTSIEETTAILKGAAWTKQTGKDLEGFVRDVSMATQALDGLGASSEELVKLAWNIQKAGVSGSRTGEVLSGLTYAAQHGNVTFDELSSMLQENNDWFVSISASGGDAAKAMVKLAALQANFGNAWLDMKPTMGFIDDLRNREKWGEMGNALGFIAQASGRSIQELKGLAEQGDSTELAIARMSMVLNIPDQYLDMPERLAEVYGTTREEVNQARNAYKLTNEEIAAGLTPQEKMAKVMRETAAAAEADAAQRKSLQASFDAFNATLANVWNRLSKKIVPILWELGKPMVWLAGMALKPVVWAMDILSAIFRAIPGPIKTVVGLFLGATVAVAAYNAALAAGIIESIAAKAAVIGHGLAVAATTVYQWAAAAAAFAYGLATGSVSISTLAATAATWLFNAALYANPIGLVVLAIVGLVAGMALLVYGFMEGVTWAKWLGAAILFMTGPFGMAVAMIALLYDTIFGGGDMLESLFDTLAGGMDWLANAITGAVDWAVAAIEALPDKIVAFVGGIPDMIAGIFSGTGESRIGEAFGKMFDAGLRLVYAMFVKIPQAIGTLMVKGLIGYGNILISVLTWPFRTAFNTIKDIVLGVWDWISNLFSSGLSIGGQLYDVVIGSIKGLINSYVVDPINNFVTTLNGILDWIPGVGEGAVEWRMAKLAEGGVVTGPTNALMGESGPEAVIPLTDVRAVGEFAKATGGASPEVTVNLNQDKVEALLTEIRDVLAAVAAGMNPRTAGATTGGGGGGGMMKRASNWEY